MEINEDEILILKNDFENGKIIDFRDHANPNNKIAIICDYASNSLPDGYSWTEHDQKFFANEPCAWDPAALETALYIASEMKCVLAHSVYTRLLVDVDRDITCVDIFPRQVNKEPVELNQNLTSTEESNRILKYHISFYYALREISEKVDPDIVVSIHSFDVSDEEDENLSKLQIGVKFADSEEFGQRLCEEMKKRGYQADVNQPLPEDNINSMNTVVRANYPVRREGVSLGIRNSILQDEEKAAQVRKDLVEVLNEMCAADEEGDL